MIEIKYFSAVWCGPCKTFSPVVSEVKSEYSSIVNISKLDVDDNSDIAKEYNVQSIPTLIYFRDGKEVSRTSGALSKQELIRNISVLNK
jgi:thioredoxin 1